MGAQQFLKGIVTILILTSLNMACKELFQPKGEIQSSVKESRSPETNSITEGVLSSFDQKKPSEVLVKVNFFPKNAIEREILNSFAPMSQKDLDHVIKATVAAAVKDSGQPSGDYESIRWMLEFPEIVENGIPKEIDDLMRDLNIKISQDLYQSINNLVQRYNTPNGANTFRSDVLRLAFESAGIDRSGVVRDFVDRYNIWPSASADSHEGKFVIGFSFDF